MSQGTLRSRQLLLLPQLGMLALVQLSAQTHAQGLARSYEPAKSHSPVTGAVWNISLSVSIPKICAEFQI